MCRRQRQAELAAQAASELQAEREEMAEVRLRELAQEFDDHSKLEQARQLELNFRCGTKGRPAPMHDRRD